MSDRSTSCLRAWSTCWRFLPLVLNLELLIPGIVGNTFHAHRLRQVLPGRRLPDIAADKNRRVPEFLRYAWRQIDLTASPCRVDDRVSKRSQCQRIERWPK